MNLDHLLLLELLGTNTRPDASGVRSHGLDAGVIKREKNYPYDENDEDYGYGQPNDVDRGNAGGRVDHGTFTPRGLNVWQEAASVVEAMGTPMFFQKAYSSNRGTPVPGGNSSVTFARMPSHIWDDDDDPEKKAEEFEAKEYFDPKQPSLEKIESFVSNDQTDDDLERKLDKIWDRDNNNNFLDPNEFQAGSEYPSVIMTTCSPPNHAAALGLGSNWNNSHDIFSKRSIWDLIAPM